MEWNNSILTDIWLPSRIINHFLAATLSLEEDEDPEEEDELPDDELEEDDEDELNNRIGTFYVCVYFSYRDFVQEID